MRDRTAARPATVILQNKKKSYSTSRRLLPGEGHGGHYMDMRKFKSTENSIMRGKVYINFAGYAGEGGDRAAWRSFAIQIARPRDAGEIDNDSRSNDNELTFQSVARIS